MAILTGIGGPDVPFAVSIDHDPTVTATDVPQGSIIIDSTGRWWRKRDNGSTTNVDLISDPTELIDLVPQPEMPVTNGTGAIAAAATLAGGSYIVPMRCLINRIIFRVTVQSGAPTIRLLLYQAPGGLSRNSSNVATLIGQVLAFAIPTASTTYVAALDGGSTVPIEKGILYVLWGNSAGTGSFSLRSYGTANVELFLSSVDADTHPLAYTTALSASAVSPDATFDPRNNPPGAATPSGAANTIPVLRFKKV